MASLNQHVVLWLDLSSPSTLSPVVSMHLKPTDEFTPSRKGLGACARCFHSHKFPAQLIIQMACASHFWLNVLPPTPGVSGDINPRELIAGTMIDCAKHCQLKCGQCAQVHKEHDNSVAARTAGALVMRPTGNTQGGHHFCSLNASRTLNQSHHTPSPMPNDVINRAHNLAKKAPIGVTFADKRNNVHTDDNDEMHAMADETDDETLASSIAGVDEQELNNLALPDPPVEVDVANDNVADNNQPAIIKDDNEKDEVTDDNEGNKESKSNADHGSLCEEESLENESEDENNEATRVVDDEAGDSTDEDPEPPVNRGAKTNGALRKISINGAKSELMPGQIRRQIWEGHANATEGNEHSPEDRREELLKKRRTGVKCPTGTVTEFANLMATVFTQLNMKQGIKAFGDKGIATALKEPQQLHDRAVMKPKHANKLTKVEKRAALQRKRMCQWHEAAAMHQEGRC